MTEELINKLNSACQAFQGSCDLKCDKIGWCQACWIATGCEAQEPSSSVGRADAIHRVGGPSPS